jgi:hypothetical protein
MHVIIKLFYFISAKSILGKSCKDILARDKFAVSGTYWIQPAVNKLFQVYCDMETHGEAGPWFTATPLQITTISNLEAMP